MAKRAERKKEAVQRPLSPADQMDAAALDASVQMMIGVLEAWNYNRPLSSLNRADLKALAVAAVSGFVLEQSRQQQRVDLTWDGLITAADYVA